MRLEFPEIYDELFQSGYNMIIDHLRAKKRKIKECVKEKAYGDSGGAAALLFRKKETESDTDEDLLNFRMAIKQINSGNIHDNKDPLNKTIN